MIEHLTNEQLFNILSDYNKYSELYNKDLIREIILELELRKVIK